MDAMIIKSKTIKQSRINYDLYVGEISLDAIAYHTKKRLLADDFNKTFNFLIDIRGAMIIDFITDIEKFTNFIAKCLKDHSLQNKFAFVTSSPVEIVHSEQFVEKLNKKGIRLICGNFSSVETAINWLCK